MNFPQRIKSILKGIVCIALSLLLSLGNAAPSQALSSVSGNEFSYTPDQAAPLTQSSLATCMASSDWVTQPNPPNEIPGDGENFCQFYQFSWQWFLYLMSPSASDASLRNFQNTQDYPILQVEGEDSCSSKATEPVFFLRMVKDPKDESEFVLPERISQAGGGATIYSQNKDVVFYSISFGRDLCTAPKEGNLPVDTTEIKTAWKTIREDEKANYIWINADVIPESGAPVKETLGLVGYHLARGTSKHPELIWTSYEHKSNAPNCLNPSASVEPEDSWSFLSEPCSQCLASPSADCFKSCKYNKAQKAKKLTAETPSEICRVFPQGTAPGDSKGEENISDVNALNDQIVGDNGILTQLPASDPMAVMANYFNIGGLWLNENSEDASMASQRGSLQLENATMETTYQGDLTLKKSKIKSSKNNALNCFTCHKYTRNHTATSQLSHIFDDILKAKK